ncbi:DUF805 domain-containing protein [Selenomonas sp. F0473]|uniref:DUF805 domain-containing protein n=1 Tax=Selenomonas sp. F0473 TaxID=999423 RepID=UPI00029E269E|nr:DUF805 domain-containing protein [Selenomonas sp. F0473]EKU72121.1 hypothetical protein HMPREF9161_00806 [Selenomonas sp. F0473]
MDVLSKLKNGFLYFFRFSGRMGRKEFIRNILFLLLFTFLFSIVALPIGELVSPDKPDVVNFLFIFLFAVCYIGIILAGLSSFSFCIRRARDISKHCIIAIPIIFLLLFYLQFQQQHAFHQTVNIASNTMGKNVSKDAERAAQKDARPYVEAYEGYKQKKQILMLLFPVILAALPTDSLRRKAK